jgi:hypothetical protein
LHETTPQTYNGHNCLDALDGTLPETVIVLNRSEFITIISRVKTATIKYFIMVKAKHLFCGSENDKF